MYYMYAHMHDVSQKTLRELPAVGTQDTMTFYKWEWPGSNKKARNLAQILASWLEGLEGWWPRGFPKSITISPFVLKRFEWVTGGFPGFNDQDN